MIIMIIIIMEIESGRWSFGITRFGRRENYKRRAAPPVLVLYYTSIIILSGSWWFGYLFLFCKRREGLKWVCEGEWKDGGREGRRRGNPPSPKKGCIIGRVMVGGRVRVNSERIVHYRAGFALQIVPVCSREGHSSRWRYFCFFPLTVLTSRWVSIMRYLLDHSRVAKTICGENRCRVLPAIHAHRSTVLRRDVQSGEK